jgi:acyl-coenzyme A thioesterase PaaI-like protein
VSPDAPPAAEFVHAFVATSPFARRTGLEVVDLSPDRAELRLPFDEGNVTVADVVGGLCFCAAEATDMEGRTVAAAIGTYRYA